MNRDRLLRLLCRALLFLEAAGCVSILLGLYRRLFLPFFKEHPVWIDGVIIAAGGALLCAGLMALLRRSASCNGPLPRQLAIGGLPCLSGLLWYVVAITDGPRHMSLFSLFERPAWVIALLAIAFICILQAVSPEWRERVRPRFTTMRRGTAALCLALVVLAVLLLRISHLWGTIPAMTGDEPFYAIAADSLIDDGDLYLRNNTLSNKARIWYPTPPESSASADPCAGDIADPCALYHGRTEDLRRRGFAFPEWCDSCVCGAAPCCSLDGPSRRIDFHAG